ncbi:MAG: molybdate ABC transporter substrate-binding protein [Sphingomonadales bacterium]
MSLILCWSLGLGGQAWAGTARVAVAANFTAAAKEIGALFETESGHRLVFSFGSTGLLYTQISQGAPFDVFLAADQARPAKAIAEGYGVASSLFTYATGRLVLYSIDPKLVQGPQSLTDAHFNKIALANPLTAPYGAAAVQTMQALGVADLLTAKRVQGSNITQTYQFVATGNAALGFVALSQVAGDDQGSRWLVPQALHDAIAQDAILLRTGADNVAARAFLAFLQGPAANAVKTRFGYGTGAGND